MYMRFLISLFILFFLNAAYSENISSIKVKVDAAVCPVTYDFGTDSLLNAINGTASINYSTGTFSFGGSVSESYKNFNKASDKIVFTGGDNTLGFYFNFFYRPFDFFELQTHTGLGWLSSSFNYNNYGNINKQLLGPSLKLNGTFHIKEKLLSIDVINQVDFMFLLNTSSDDFRASKLFTPMFYTGGRINVYPNIEWFSFYTEAGVSVWNYSSYSINVNTAVVKWSIGCSFNLKVSDKNTITVSPVIIRPQQYAEDARLKKFRNASVGDALNFSDIHFHADSVEVKDESLGIIKSIADVLIQERNSILEVRGHTNNTGNKEKEYELSLKRAEAIVNKLTEYGVDRSRFTVKGAGSDYPLFEGINQENRRVEFIITSVLTDVNK